MSHRAVEFYDERASIYDLAYGTAIDQAEDRVLGRWLRRGGAFQPGTRLLDLGCGTGKVLEFAQHRSCVAWWQSGSYLGVDASVRMLGIARRRWAEPRVEFCEADFLNGEMPRRLMVPADSVVALFSGCFDPLPEVARIVRQVLRPGGRYFLALLGRRHAERRHSLEFGAGRFSHYATAQQIREVFGPGARIRGLSGYTDSIPAPLLPIGHRLESFVLGRMWPNACYFLLVDGTR